MEYGDILRQVEEQKKEKKLSGKIFRYAGLVLAVDYFSQKLTSDQIMIAAFDFVNELLTLDSSSLYCIRDDRMSWSEKRAGAQAYKPSIAAKNSMTSLFSTEACSRTELRYINISMNRYLTVAI